MSLFSGLFSKALSTQLTVTSSNGFHLRPVAQFASLAKSYVCQITASTDDKNADAKSVTTLLSLSLDRGDTFTLQTKGKNAQAAMDALETLFLTLMSEDKVYQEAEKTVSNYSGDVLKGAVISRGIAIAKTYTYQTESLQHKSDVGFQEALHTSLNALERAQKSDRSGIYLAQKELLIALGKNNQNLETFEAQIEEESKQLLGTKLEAKRADYSDILQRVKKHMGLEIKVIFPDIPFILLGDDLLPSEIDVLAHTQVQGVVLKRTSLNAHTAILLRAAGIPSLIADKDTLVENETVILDTYAGLVVRNPAEADIAKAEALIQKHTAQKEQSASKRFNTAETRSGKRVHVLANITDLKTAGDAKAEGAEGVGLFRTEFLFKEEKPTFEMQVRAYKEVFDHFDNTTIRTLDVGGDKALPYIKLDKEENPFLGIRGIRLFKTHPELMQEQLLAILTAAQNRKIKVMFPMVSSVSEFIEVKTLAQKLALEKSIEISNIQFGIMIEVPSTLFLLDHFNQEVDFYSIGTNDLTQYLFAIERTHSTLDTDPLSSVVFDALKLIMDKTKKPVSICGELASNTEAIPKLIDLGIETLSVSAKSIAETKEEIRHV
ncbi:HPr family phosphocarrier protein [Sulfurovum sp.]|uniref:HPr family phosphocarrier protein n=1 Tax=Sulfurovum sp. TaxID=1969726 RepID=UPI0028680561|nr:HPr family phosphocarrier protein [Sulfurovum sp.]